MINIPPPDNSEYNDVIGELHINGNHYCIISLDAMMSEKPKAGKISNRAECLSGKKICEFILEGCNCAVFHADTVNADSDNELSCILTARELQIATMVAQGQLNKQIAHLLKISEWTVATHIRRIFAKLSVDTRAAMVYRCASLISHYRPEDEIPEKNHNSHRIMQR